VAASGVSGVVRKIIHIDMDCFYAAVEIRERPELRGRPVAVGGGSRRGVVTTCNYEARRFGVRSAMPGFKARELCPDLVMLPVRFELYRAVSRQIRGFFLEVTPMVEPLSLDEAYLDVTGTGRRAWEIARGLRARIRAETGLTCSAGVASNKMLAKIASEWRKPDGQFAILPEDVAGFMKTLPVSKLWGVGPKSVRRLNAEGIHTCGDLQRIDRVDLVRRFGRWGEELFHLCRGEDERPVVADRVRKSLSNERTFASNLESLEEAEAALPEMIAELQHDLAALPALRPIHKLFVKVKFADFTRTTRECIAAAPDPRVFLDLLREARGRSPHGVRLLGVGVRFAPEETETGAIQQEFPFSEPEITTFSAPEETI